jgi:hypothetical protein
MNILSRYFYDLGFLIIKGENCRGQKSNSTNHRSFRSFFGVSADVCAELWKLLHPVNVNGASPKHLLWALFFLKVYPTESIGASMVGHVDEKTYRKWVWIFVDKISDLCSHLVCQVFCVNYIVTFTCKH